MVSKLSGNLTQAQKIKVQISYIPTTHGVPQGDAWSLMLTLHTLYQRS